MGDPVLNKVQAYFDFWGKFGWQVYDENSVPDDASLPYITSDFSYDSFLYEVGLTPSLWDRSTSWETVEQKAAEIEQAIGRGGVLVKYDGGAFWLKKANPFAQRLADEDDSIRRIVINISVEYID